MFDLCEASEACLEPMVMGAGAPGRNHIAGMYEVIKKMSDQTLIPHPAVEGFHKAVLPPLPGSRNAVSMKGVFANC